jgi:hypothetical protein
MLSLLMLSVIMLSVVMLSVVTPTQLLVLVQGEELQLSSIVR